ncbi:MAG: hypothetical protein M1828_004308 [Chrysothrix sp. TS-e1954]|nr:MAG: hypothetical protein M1828_004308 [Chrysothrix sp. TS-e1954]
MASALQLGSRLVGRTGVRYQLRKVIYERTEQRSKGAEKLISRLWLADSDNGPHVVKPVGSELYQQAFDQCKDLSPSPYVRLPVDSHEPSSSIILQHYTEDFLKFMQSGPTFRAQVKRILRDILRGIVALHRKRWVHCDVKPSNVLVSYTTNPDGSRNIDRVVLCDLEAAVKLNEKQLIHFAVGNVLWRSPEALAGYKVGFATDVWSFGVTAIYGIMKLVIFAYDEVGDDVIPAVSVAANQLSYFGPLPVGLALHLEEHVWSQVFTELHEGFSAENPRRPFALWSGFKSLLPGDKEFIMRSVNLDPAARPTAEELLKDEWFDT